MADARSQVNRRAILLTLFGVVLVDIMGYTIVLPMLPFYAEHMGASPLVVGSIVSVYALCQMIAGPYLGRLSDRRGRRPVLIFSQMGTLAGFVMLALANSLPLIFIARIIDGLTAGNVVVAQAYVADVTPSEERTRAMGLIGAAFGLGFFLGPSISAFFSSYSFHAPLWAACGLSALAITGSILVLKEPYRPETRTETQAEAKTRARRPRLAHLLREPKMRWPLLSFFFFAIAFSLLVSGLALFSERVLTWDGKPFSQREVGWVFTYGGLLGLIIQTVLIGPAVAMTGEKRLASLSFLSLTVGFCLISSSATLALFVIGYTLVQCGASFLRPTLNGLISRTAPRNMQGVIFGVTQTLLSIAQIGAPLLSGALIEAKHYSIWALLGAVVAAFGLVWVRLIKQLGNPAGPVSQTH